MKKVLITGMSGIIGSDLRRHLEDVGGYELSALNRSPVEGVKWFQADIADLKEVEKACVGQDTVVHLSAHLPDGEDGDIWEGNLSSNIIGTYNIYEASRIQGVKRVIFASSGDAARGWDNEEPYNWLTEGNYNNIKSPWKMVPPTDVWPKGIYGASKVWGEAIGRHFSDEYSLSVICLRIGAVLPENKPSLTRHYSTWLSHNDIRSAISKSIDAPDDLKFGIFFVNSDNKWNYRDLNPTREHLKWDSVDTADKFHD